MIGRRIFLYTDYEAARYGLIKSTSPTQNKRLDRQTSTDPSARTGLRGTGSRSSPTWESRLARASCREGTRRSWSNNESEIGRGRCQELILLARVECARRKLLDYCVRLLQALISRTFLNKCLMPPNSARGGACARRKLPDYSSAIDEREDGKLCGSDRVSGQITC